MKQPKNVIFICADQLRADAILNSEVMTPNLDRLARNGISFTKAYTPNPICVPARATMITGTYSHHATGHKGNAGRIRDDQFKLPEFLNTHGYHTYAAGKLHYVPYSPPGTPRLLHGFEKAAICESGRILKQFDPEGQLRGVEDYFDYLSDQGWFGYTRAHGIGNNDIHPAPSPLPSEHYVDAWVVQQAMTFLDEHRSTHPDKPFFLHVGFPKPHSPYDPPRPFDELYEPRLISTPHQATDNRPRSPHCRVSAQRHGWQYLSPQAIQVARAHYFGCITFQDRQIGRLLAYLEREGFLDDTLIIYTADHGDM
ncbi:MAG: hypothetical protein D6820_02545, partial [Lentisphaerae bacterium]